jgi:hypothetical protein
VQMQINPPPRRGVLRFSRVTLLTFGHKIVLCNIGRRAADRNVRSPQSSRLNSIKLRRPAAF